MGAAEIAVLILTAIGRIVGIGAELLAGKVTPAEAIAQMRAEVDALAAAVADGGKVDQGFAANDAAADARAEAIGSPPGKSAPAPAKSAAALGSDDGGDVTP